MKEKIIGGLAILALVLSFVGLVGGDNQSAPSVGTVLDGRYTTYNGLKLVDSSRQLRFGTDTVFNDLSVQKVAITSGSTTPCSILSPTATSTMLTWSVIPTTGTTTASLFTLATSTTAFATTSAIITGNWLPMSSLTSTSTALTYAIPPSTYVNLGLAAPTATGGFVMSGYCSAVFITQ